MPYHECRPLSYLAVPLPFYSPGLETREWFAHNRLGLPISSVNGLCSHSSDRPQANLIQTVLAEALFTVEPRLPQVDALRRLTFQSPALCQQSSLQRTGFTVAIISFYLLYWQNQEPVRALAPPFLQGTTSKFSTLVLECGVSTKSFGNFRGELALKTKIWVLVCSLFPSD